MLSRVWLFTCDNAIIPLAARLLEWFEDRQWLSNPQKRVLERLIDTLHSTEDYEIWSKCAKRVDNMLDFEAWRQKEESPEYDWETIRQTVQKSRTLRETNDIPGMMHLLASCPHRGALLSDGLLKYMTGTKELIDEYFTEVEQLSEIIVNTPSVKAQEKYVLFKRVAQYHGRTALMLSGGAALGMYHIGVMKALWQADLLPRVITGASAGSIIGAFICSRPSEEVEAMFKKSDIGESLREMNLNLDAFEPFSPEKAVRRMFWRLLSGGALMDVGRLHECIKSNIGDITFSEAYEVSGRVLNVTVTSTREAQTTLILNYLTAPNVLVRTAVCASCAVSGVFEPVELLAKTAAGRIVPYCPSRQRWCDGSINMDLPVKRIAELFNINYVIISQVQCSA